MQNVTVRNVKPWEPCKTLRCLNKLCCQQLRVLNCVLLVGFFYSELKPVLVVLSQRRERINPCKSMGPFDKSDQKRLRTLKDFMMNGGFHLKLQSWVSCFNRECPSVPQYVENRLFCWVIDWSSHIRLQTCFQGLHKRLGHLRVEVVRGRLTDYLYDNFLNKIVLYCGDKHQD
jgi:hypothetical protein